MRYRIAEARKFRRMSQEELARRSGVSRTIISNLESGEKNITTTKTLEKIAKALNVKISDLFYAEKV